MLTVYRFDHISQVVADLQPQVRLLEGLFGFRRRRSWENRSAGCRGVMLDIPGSWNQRWEVLAPLRPDSPLQTFLDTPSGPGIHHVALEVPDLDDAVRELLALGYDDRRIERDASGRWVDAPMGPLGAPSSLRMRLFAPPVHGLCGDDRSPAEDASAGRPPEPPAADVPSLGIIAAEQVGHAIADRDALVAWAEDTLGMREVYRTPEGRWPDMATLVLTLPGTRIRWEAIQPVGAESFVGRFLDKRGPGAHHVTFEVADWGAVDAACVHHGIESFGLSQGETDGARWCDAFIHPRYTGGFLVQLFWEEWPGVWSRSDKVPARHRRGEGR